jgi:hypothetical protein
LLAPGRQLTMWTRATGGPSAAGTDSTPRGELTNWRMEQLVRAGFDAELAASVAADRAMDLHELIELVERGCPPAPAARILAPLDREGELY